MYTLQWSSDLQMCPYESYNSKQEGVPLLHVHPLFNIRSNNVLIVEPVYMYKTMCSTLCTTLDSIIRLHIHRYIHVYA